MQYKIFPNVLFLMSYHVVRCAQSTSLCSKMLTGRVTACHSSSDIPAFFFSSKACGLTYKSTQNIHNKCPNSTPSVCHHTATTMHQHPFYTTGEFNYDLARKTAAQTSASALSVLRHVHGAVFLCQYTSRQSAFLTTRNW